MTGPMRATVTPLGVTHYWRIGWTGTFCGLERPPRALVVGKWPRDCKRCVRTWGAKPERK